MKSSCKILGMIALILVGVGLMSRVGFDKVHASEVVYSTANLNVRSEASTNGTIVVTVPAGTALTVIETVTDWYGITCSYNGMDYTGYVKASYTTTVAPATATPAVTATPEPAITPIPVYKDIVTYQDNPVSAKITAKVRTRKTAKGKYYKVNKKIVSLKKNQSVKVYGQTVKKNQVWYRVRFNYAGKKRYAYVLSDYVKLKLTSKVNAEIITAKNLVVRKTANGKNLKVSGKQVKLKKGNAVKILQEKTVKGRKWFRISFTYKKKTKKGYVPARYVKISKKKIVKKQLITVALNDAEFETEMTRQGFPESYKPLLRTLHKKYPFWQFQAMKTGLDWNTVIDKESVVGVNLIPNSKSSAWKSKDPKAYDATTGKYTVFDGSTWVAASREAVSYYMDPRNFITVQGIFQFELLSYQNVYQTEAGVNNILTNTPFAGKSFTYDNNGTNRTLSYSKAFVEAASKSGVSPYHLASRMKQEVVTSASTTSMAVTGTTAQYPGIFNFYNIGATHATAYSPALNGLKWASSGSTYMRPWNNRYKSIVGGAIYIGSNYINKGQNTLYLEKFNVTASNTYGHQYMANVEAANAEAIKTKNAYSGMLDSAPIIFSIPVFHNMPATICPMPK